MLDLETFHRRVLGDDSLYQPPQRRDIPLPAAQLEERPPAHLRSLFLEKFVEVTARGKNNQLTIEDDERLGKGVNDG